MTRIDFSQYQRWKDNEARLSPMQRRYLRLLAQGYARKDLGVAYGVKKGTIDSQLSDAFRRVGAESAIQACLAVGYLILPVDIKLDSSEDVPCRA